MTVTTRGTRSGRGAGRPRPRPAAAPSRPGAGRRAAGAGALAVLAGVWVGAFPLPPGAVVAHPARPGRSARSASGRARRAGRHRGGGAAASCGCRGCCSPSSSGPALAVSGAAYQGVFRNPLADPYLLGAAAGAGLGATLVIAYSPVAVDRAGRHRPARRLRRARWSASAAPSRWAPRPAARTARRCCWPASPSPPSSPRRRPSCSSRTPRTCARSTAGCSASSAARSGPTSAGAALPRRRPAPCCCFCGRALDVLAVGDDEARSLGVHPGRLRLLVILAASLATAAAVAVSGLIGFVGLVVPHIVRRLVGGSLRPRAARVAAGRRRLPRARRPRRPRRAGPGRAADRRGHRLHRRPVLRRPAVGRGAAAMTADRSRPGRPAPGSRSSACRAAYGRTRVLDARPADRRARRLAGGHRAQRLGQVHPAALGARPAPPRRARSASTASRPPACRAASGPGRWPTPRSCPCCPRASPPATTSLLGRTPHRPLLAAPRGPSTGRSSPTSWSGWTSEPLADRPLAHPVRRRAAARRPGPGAGAAAAGAAARRADRRAGPRPRPAGARPGRPAAPPGRADRASARCTTSRWPASTPTGWPCSPPAGSSRRAPPPRCSPPRRWSTHYGARAEVVHGPDGPAVLPVRSVD